MPAIILAIASLLLLTGCGPSGPTEADMAGCAVRSGGPPISVVGTPLTANIPKQFVVRSGDKLSVVGV